MDRVVGVPYFRDERLPVDLVQRGVVEGVVLGVVPRFDQAGGQLRVRLHVLPQHEERRHRAVLCQHFQYAWRPGRVGTVVECQVDDGFPGPAVRSAGRCGRRRRGSHIPRLSGRLRDRCLQRLPRCPVDHARRRQPCLDLQLQDRLARRLVVHVVVAPRVLEPECGYAREPLVQRPHRPSPVPRAQGVLLEVRRVRRVEERVRARLLGRQAGRHLNRLEVGLRFLQERVVGREPQRPPDRRAGAVQVVR